MQSIEIKVKCDNLTIAINRLGDQSLPPIIALHGWLDNANSFTPLAKCLAHHCIYAVDLPGHGLSSHLPAGMNYHFIDGIYHVIQLIETLSLGPCPLMGHSMGACLASMIAASAPTLFSKLILIEGLGPLTLADNDALSQYQRHLAAVERLKHKSQRLYPDIDSAAAIRAKGGYLDSCHARTLVERGVKVSSNGFVFRHDKRLLLPSANRLTEGQVLSFLQGIEASTLLLLATDGFNVDKEQMALRQRQVKHLQTERLAGGHHIHMEQAAACATLIERFMQS